VSQPSYLAPAGKTELTGASQLVHTGDCVFYGISVIDEAAGSIKVQVYDGTDDTGVHLCQISINSNQDDRLWFGPNGIKCDVGLYLKVYSGTPSGAIFWR
jgi:hypothetical protein